MVRIYSFPRFQYWLVLTISTSYLHGFMSGEALDGMTDEALFGDFCLV